ncbi:MAG: tetratricopeptide repeat protein [Fibrobacteres bacterium]|nr:tetratricopeptide repeat protein [Fibrobacterota bacterium]
MKKAVILIFLAAFFLGGCASRIAIVKKDEWEAQKAEIKRMQDLMDAYHRDDVQQLKILRADIGQMVGEINHNLNRLSGQLEENKYGLEKLSQTTEKLSERKYIIKTIAKGADSSSAAVTDTTAADSVIVEDQINVQKLFQVARKDFSSQDYDRAKTAFEDIIAKFPASNLADDCLYWIAEIQYVKKQYKEAVLIYKRIVKEYPSADIVPAAIFKAGLCFDKMGDKTNQQKAWNELLEKFPYSDEALQVKARVSP